MNIRELGTRWAVTLVALLASTHALAGVDEIIAQFPANDAAEANRLFEALLSEGEEALTGLCGRVVPLGEGDDNAARYALTGLARYTSRPDAGEDRDLMESALLAGLAEARNPEVKAYLLRQLQQCGTNDSVAEISALVENSLVASHAILALDAIDTWRARRALAKLLKKTHGETQLEVISALSDEGSNWQVARAIRTRLEANPDAYEYQQLLSMLVDVADDNATRDLIAAMDQSDPRIRETALAYAMPMLDSHAERKWRKKVLDKDLPDAVKREIGVLLAAYEAEE